MVVATKQKTKPTTTHRKRQGHHQKRNTHFMKAYWPYLPIALVVGVSLLINTYAIQPRVLSYATNMTVGGLLNGTNQERAKNNLGTLALNDSLSRAAQSKAEDMAKRDYWAHNTPDGQEPWVFINNTGYQYLAAGENLAYGFGSSDQAIIGWMNSPGHRANILNADYSEIGFGIVNSANYQTNGEQTIVVAMYAKPLQISSDTVNTPDESEQIAASNPTQQPIAIKKSSEVANGIAVGATVPGPRKVAHVQMATSGAAPWSLFALSTLTIILLLFFITRHSIAWHRTIVKGEQFFIKHKMLDVVIVSIIMAAAILSQTAGFIQ